MNIVYILLPITPTLYWSGQLALALVCCAEWYVFGMTARSRPARAKPFYRRPTELLPFMVLKLQIESSDQGHAALVLVLW